jgi:hypothetical protein
MKAILLLFLASGASMVCVFRAVKWSKRDFMSYTLLFLPTRLVHCKLLIVLFSQGEVLHSI